MSALACVGLCTNALGTDPDGDPWQTIWGVAGGLRHPPSDDHFADVKETENKLSQR